MSPSITLHKTITHCARRLCLLLAFRKQAAMLARPTGQTAKSGLQPTPSKNPQGTECCQQPREPDGRSFPGKFQMRLQPPLTPRSQPCEILSTAPCSAGSGLSAQISCRIINVGCFQLLPLWYYYHTGTNQRSHKHIPKPQKSG